MNINFLDKIPKPIKHWVLVFVGAAIAFIATTIKAHHGLDGLDLVKVLEDAGWAGLVAVITVILNATFPFTKEYNIKTLLGLVGIGGKP